MIVIIPTYNEKDNVEKLINHILSLKSGINILAVDDNSPDGTGEILDRISREFPEVSVIHRENKLGLGSACLSGFKYALDKGFDYICTMDADFSHSPSYLPGLIKAVAGYDLAIGSRYVAGGGIANWSIFRRLLSKYANSIAKNTLNFNINDATSGFRCYTRRALDTIELDGILSEGYAFNIEILYRFKESGLRAKEIPIIFYEREHGFSKISRKEIIKALWLIVKLRWFANRAKRADMPCI